MAGAIALLGGGCGEDEPTSVADRPPEQEGPEDTAAVGTAALGSPITLAGQDEGAEVEVTPLEVVDPAPHDGVFPPEGRYVAIRLRVRNVGERPYEVGSLDAAILDESGQRVVPSLFSSDAGPPFALAGPIPPGGEEVAFVTWDMPTGATPAGMRFTTDNGFGPDSGEWTL